VLNSWDTVEQVLGDLYATWKEILGLTIVAFGKFILFVLPVYVVVTASDLQSLPLPKLTGKVQLLPKTIAH